MSIATEITRLQGAKADLKTAIENKGVTVSSSALLDAYPALVDSIQSGSPEEKLLNFYDYDGTLVASYEGSEIAGLTALPTAPDHSTDTVPLTFDEWNWTLAEIKAYNTANPNAVIIVGANYHTTDGKLHLIFKIDDVNYADAFFYFTSGSCSVDWGDGTTESVTIGQQTHTYSQVGTYHCIAEFSNASQATISFGGSDLAPKYLNLQQIFLPANIKNGAAYLASYCNYLQTISIPSGFSFRASNYAFKNCKCINNIVISRTQTSVGNASYPYFYDCFAKIISYPGNTTSIFGPGNGVSTLTIPSGVTSIDTNLFNNSNNLKAITIPNNVTTLGGNAFYNCAFLQDVTISNTLTSIENQTFYRCSLLKRVSIPASVTSIKTAAFQECTCLETVSFVGTSLSSLESKAFYGCGLLKSITIPAGITSIGVSCFEGCSLLEGFTVPEDVTTINEKAFRNCRALASVSLPSSLVTLDSNVFQNCSQLATITSLATTPPTATSSFPSSVTKIYVPYSADHSILDAYKIASNWSNFASVMEELPQ